MRLFLSFGQAFGETCGGKGAVPLLDAMDSKGVALQRSKSL